MSELTRLGFMRLHDFPVCHELIVDSLADIVDGLVFFVNEYTHPRFVALAHSHPKTLDVIERDRAFENIESLNFCFGRIARYEPEFVLYPDHDELLPALLSDFMEELDWSKVNGVEFNFVTTLDDTMHLAVPGAPQMPHAKVLKWRKDLAFKMPPSGDPVYAKPINYTADSYSACPYPLRHLFCMTRGIRVQRLMSPQVHNVRTALFFAEMNHYKIPYRHDMTYAEYEHASELLGCPIPVGDEIRIQAMGL